MFRPRKVHVKRIFGKRRGNVEDRDIWADLARIDEYEINLRGERVEPSQPGKTDRQNTRRRLHWFDAPGEDGNPSRKTTILKITNPTDPSDNPDDPDYWIEVPLIKRMWFKMHGFPDGSGGQNIGLVFKNEMKDENGNSIPTKRRIKLQRITHRDMQDSGIDDRLNNGELIKIEDYKKSDSNDENQYVDVEVMKAWRHQIRDGAEDVSSLWQTRDYTYTDDQPKPDDGNKPYRFDPFQNVVNIKWPSEPVFAGFAMTWSWTPINEGGDNRSDIHCEPIEVEYTIHQNGSPDQIIFIPGSSASYRFEWHDPGTFYFTGSPPPWMVGASVSGSPTIESSGTVSNCAGVSFNQGLVVPDTYTALGGWWFQGNGVGAAAAGTADYPIETWLLGDEACYGTDRGPAGIDSIRGARASLSLTTAGIDANGTAGQLFGKPADYYGCEISTREDFHPRVLISWSWKVSPAQYSKLLRGESPWDLPSPPP